MPQGGVKTRAALGRTGTDPGRDISPRDSDFQRRAWGAALGGLRLVCPLASGRQPTYVARAPGGTELFVVERIEALDEADAARLLRIGRRLAVLRHPNIAPLPSVERGHDEVLAVSELLDAERYDTVVEASLAARRPMPLSFHLRVLLDVLHGLGVLHGLRDASGDLNLVHGDVRPAHILLGTDGNVKLAQALPAPVQATAYTAPEVGRRSGPVDCRADVYSCGAILWEALARRRFADAPSGILPRRPSNRARLPPVSNADSWALPLAQVAAHAVSPDPNDRHASAEELAADVLRIAGPRVATGAALGASVRRLCGAQIAERRREFIADVERISVPIAPASVQRIIPAAEEPDAPPQTAPPLIEPAAEHVEPPSAGPPVVLIALALLGVALIVQLVAFGLVLAP